MDPSTLAGALFALSATIVGTELIKTKVMQYAGAFNPLYLIKDINGVPELIETKADICKGCETFYKEYTDPKGKKIDEIGSNFNITYQNII